jgi:hypothetical protein
MATRSLICKVYTDGSVEGIYCHWDGYPDHHLPLLEGHYTTDGAVEDLLRLGDLSTLGASPGTCDAYHRDQGEPLSPPRHFTSLERALERAGDQFGAEYLYSYADGKWTSHPC